MVIQGAGAAGAFGPAAGEEKSGAEQSDGHAEEVKGSGGRLSPLHWTASSAVGSRPAGGTVEEVHGDGG